MATFKLNIGYRSYLMSAADAAKVMDALASARCIDDSYMNLSDPHDPDAEGVRVWHEAEHERIELTPFIEPAGGIMARADYEAYRGAERERDRARYAAEARKEAEGA